MDKRRNIFGSEEIKKFEFIYRHVVFEMIVHFLSGNGWCTFECINLKLRISQDMKYTYTLLAPTYMLLAYICQIKQ